MIVSFMQNNCYLIKFGYILNSIIGSHVSNITVITYFLHWRVYNNYDKNYTELYFLNKFSAYTLFRAHADL